MEINCNVVKDLIPTYIEASCSDYTKSVIDEHMANCDSCKQLLVNFKKYKIITDNNEPQKVIIHITKQRNIFMAISSILFFIILTAAIISCKLFVVGSTVPTLIIDTVKFEMKDEKTFSYQFNLMSANQVMNKTVMTAPDELGNVYIRIYAVLLSPLNNPYHETKGSNRYDREINAVYLQGKDKNDIAVLWEKE